MYKTITVKKGGITSLLLRLLLHLPPLLLHLRVGTLLRLEIKRIVIITIDSFILFNIILLHDLHSWSWTERHLPKEVLVLSSLNPDQSIFSPGFSPSVFCNPVGFFIFVLVPSYDFPLLEASELFGSIDILINTRLVCKKIEIDLRSSNNGSIVHDLPLDVLLLLDYAEVEDLVGLAFGHLCGRAVCSPVFVVVGPALFVDEAFGSDIFEEGNKNSSIATSLKFLLVITRSVGLSIKSLSFS